jgi:hypothetical protein
MSCNEQYRMLLDENEAWAAHRALEGSTDEKELTRRYNNACDASTRLRQHLAICPACQLPKG